MRDGFAVIDADRHLIEPSDLWDRYMDAPYRGRVQILGPNQSRRLVDGKPISDADELRGGVKPNQTDYGWSFTGSANYRKGFADAFEHGFDAASNLRDMDREGVDVAVLFPTLGLYIIWSNDIAPDLQAQICRAYNRWLAEFCDHNRDRLTGVMLIPLLDTDLAVKELRYAREELGLSGIFWRPNLLKGRTLAHEDYFPIYEAAQDLEVPVCVHEGARTVLPQAGSDHYSNFGRHVACHSLEQMLACLSLCGDGVLEKFPRLKVAHLESGCGWVPFWLERMDEHWEHYSHGAEKTTPVEPSTYFKRQCVISCEAGEEMVGPFVELVGADNLVMATDYPHPDAVDKFPDRTVGDLTSSPEVPADVKRKILWDNPARLYGIKAPVPLSS